MVSIILPTLDEADNIVPLIQAILVVVPQVHEIIIVDDESPDGTARIVAEFAKDEPRVKIESVPQYGLTRSLWHGIEKSTGRIIVWMDCDFSMPPELIPRLLQEIEKGADIAVGSRFIKGGSFKKDTEGTQDTWLAVLLSRVMNYSIRFLLNPRFRDYTSGFAAVRRPVFDSIYFKGDYGEYFIDFIYRALRAGYKVVEIPYTCLPRKQGYSKTGTDFWQFFSRGRKYVALAVRLCWLTFRGRL